MKASKFKTHKGLREKLGSGWSLSLGAADRRLGFRQQIGGWVFDSRSVGVQQQLAHGWTRSSFLAMAGRSTTAADRGRSSSWLDATRQQHDNSTATADHWRSSRWPDSQHGSSRLREGENVFLLLEGGFTGWVLWFFCFCVFCVCVNCKV